MVTKLKPYNPSETDLVADWHVIDATDQVLGRLSTRVAMLLMGKNKPTYVAHLPAGDFVVITNAAKLHVSGKKADSKVYVSHNQQPGHRKEVPFARVFASHPDRVIQHAVKGMLPKNKLGDRLLTRLKIYSGAEHPHAAQVAGAPKLVALMKEAMAKAAEPRTLRKPAASAPDAAAPVMAAVAAAPAAEVKKTAIRRPKAPTVKTAATAKAPARLARKADAADAAEKKPVRRPRAPGAKS